MVYKGRPSAGCENCRKMKKRCDQGLPACSRCVRLGKACGGYRDLSDLIFKDETETITRRASAQGESGSAAGPSSLTRQTTPEIQTAARKFFFDQFVTDSHHQFLQGVSPDEFLLKPIMACALVAMANRDNDDRGRELARRYYVEAINATTAAIRHMRKAREDNTLIAVCLLSMFERLTWEQGGPSAHSWRSHVEGAAQVLQVRGRSQIRTKTGAMLFRELRDKIIINCNLNEKEVPSYLVQWTQALEYDPICSPADQLSILSARLANLRAAFRQGLSTDVELLEQADTLEKDLLEWSESTLAAGSICSFHNVRDLDSPHAWNGTRHEYGIPQAHRKWNNWRCTRICLSRLQETLWRRSWASLSPPSTPLHGPEHFSSIRTRMVNDICISVAYAFGNSPAMEPPSIGAVSSGSLLILPLCIAGTVLLEQLSDPVVSPGGTRMILVDEPLHENLYNQTSTQLAWIIERLEYIADKVGIKWASVIARFLRGEKKIYYDLGRSRVVRSDEYESQVFDEVLDLGDLGELMQFTDLEEYE